MPMTYPSTALKRIVAGTGIRATWSYPAPNVAIAWVKGKEIILHGPAMGKHKAHNAKELNKCR